MRAKSIARSLIVAASYVAFAGSTQAQPDRYQLKVPNGLAFSEFEGYDAWETVAVSATKTQVKAILGNPIAIRAFRDGMPANGKPFPDGAKMVKIQWNKKVNPVAPYFVEIPNTLDSVNFIEKDTRRFPNTHGWAFAKFSYDTNAKAFKPDGTGSECGFSCHTKVAAHDYIYTAYPPR